jgi:twitching motility two-component system response regulator PilH
MTESADLRSMVYAARRIVDELSGLLASMEALMADYEQVGGPERERREEDESLRRERDDLARSLAQLRAAHEALLKQHEGKRHAGQRLKVMVVDDAPSELRMIESILRSAGHDVLSYADGDGIEDKVATHGPDLLLLDIVMPNRNGYEILRALKKDERTRHTPVAIVTGRSQESDRVWSRLQGAAEYVTKPFTAAQLLGVIQKLAG